MSPSWRRYATPRDATRPTIGDAHVAHLARLRRAPWLPWQWDLAHVAGELADDGEGFRYPVVVVHVPRRAGKTLATLAGVLARLDLTDDARCWYTAQTRETAAKLFRDEWTPMLQRLSRLYRLRKSQGSEGVHKRRGSSSLQLFAPTPEALHSVNVDTAVIDEAWAFDLDTGAGIESGVTPAQLTRPWRQTWIVSAGGTVESTYLDRWLTAGEQGGGIALFDLGAPADADVADPAVWRAAHPAYGYTVTDAALAAEWDQRVDDAAFARSILNIWPRPSTVLAAAGLDLDAWARAADTGADVGRPLAVAVDVAGDRSSAAIAAAGRDPDGRVVVRVVDERPGVGWLAGAVRDARRAWPRVPIHADALVAASIVAELRRARVEVVAVSAVDHARACSTFVDLLDGGRLAHLSQAVLDDAVAVAARRPYGDGWLWSRRLSRGTIAPLVAATLAAAAAHGGRPTGRARIATATPPTSPPAGRPPGAGYLHRGRPPIAR